MKPDNEGSVLVTVLIMFMFISVLMAIIMSSSVVNYKIRAMDRQTTNEFYYSEKALNKIYSSIGTKTTELTGELYNDVLTFNDGKVGYDSETEQETIRRFNEQYLTKLEELFLDKDSEKIDKPVKESMNYDPSSPNQKVSRCKVETLQNYISDSHASITSTPWIAYRYEHGDASRYVVTEAEFPYRSEKKYERLRAIIIKDLTITSNNTSTGFVSSITTDIVIGTPMVDFVTVNKKDLDYAVIANKGIVFENGNVNIIGNVYGGSTASNPATDGINVNNNSNVIINSRYVLSGGDININDNGSIAISNGSSECDVWFENMNVNSENANAVNINASAYALDDLTVNGNGSGVTFKGNYFGYNDGSFDVKNADAAGSNASSLIVNAKDATVNMKDLNLFVMLGNAHINHESKSPRLTLDSGVADNNKYIPTNESVTTKALQEIYLVPQEFLDSENPVIAATRKSFNVNIPDEWFGSKYLDETKTKTVYLKKGSQYVAYCYLNFKDDLSEIAESDMEIIDEDTGEKLEVKKGQVIDFNRKKYVNKIFPHAVYYPNTFKPDRISTPDDVAYPSLEEKESDSDEVKAKKAEKREKLGSAPSPKDLYGRVQKLYELQNSNIYIGEDSELDGNRVKDNGVYVYSPYGITQNSKLIDNGNSYEINLKSSTIGIERFSTYKENMYRKYVWFYTYLDPQETHALTRVESANNWPFPEVYPADLNKEGLPLARLVNIDGIAGNPTDTFGTNTKVYISNDDTYHLNERIKGFLIVNGDVIIENGVKIDGFVYATGTVTFKGNNDVHFDSTLLERRIDDEINQVKSEYKSDPGKSQAEVYKDYYLINYLLNNPASTAGSSTWTTVKKYNYFPENETQSFADINTDYRKFVSYENWIYGQTQ